MPQWDPATLSEPQRKWFASVREGLERDTGRTLAAWVEVARTCPETRHRARLGWMKTVHGLGQNRASLVFAAAFPEPVAPVESGADPLWADPLWADPGARATFEALAAVATALDGVVVGRRKGYTAFSRRYQFAAVHPAKAGGVRLGLAVPPELDPRLAPPANDGWSERLTAVTGLSGPEAVDASLAALVRQASERS